jgi:peptidoglycan/LPS O-acetylase OafA/YrhL
MVAMATLATPERPGLLHPAGMALNNVVLPLFAVSLLAGLAREETRLAKLLASRPAQFLGRVSYAFYLVHYGAMALWVFPRIAIPGWPMATWLVWLVTANVAAIVVYVAIEHPAQSALLRWSARPRAQRATMGT